MVLLSQMYYKLLFVFIACTSVLFLMRRLQTDVDKKESRITLINNRHKQPEDYLFIDNEGNSKTNAVNNSVHMCTDNTTQEHDDVQVGNVIHEEDFMRERKKVYSERRQRVEKVCNQLGIDVTFPFLESIPLRRFRWIVSRKLIMCFNAKVGTTSWSRYLLAVEKVLLKPNMNLHDTSSGCLVPPYKRSSPESLALMEKFSKIMIVRHPFARVVSAYMDKIVGKKFKGLSKNIIKRYRPSSSSSRSVIPTFEEFVKFLVDDIPRNDNIKKKYSGVLNLHWMPYYANCAPCNVNYDVILHMETISEDTRYVNDRFHLGINQQLQQNHHGNSSSELTALVFFKELSRNLILKLYQRYRVDFEMFGYTLQPFITET